MGEAETMRLIYLIVLGAVLVGWFFLQSRQNLNRNLQYAAVWGMILSLIHI